MLILRQSTAIDIRLGPFMAIADGYTPITAAQTLASWDQAEVLKENGAATSAMAGTIAAVTGGGGWYDYTVGTGDVDTVGEVVFVCQDASVFLPVFVRAMVVEEAIYDALFDAGSTGSLWTTATGFATTAEIADVPTVAEFNARTLLAADYTVVSDLGTVQTADHTAGIADIPTVAEFNARTLPAASYFDPAADTVATVTTVTNQLTAAEINIEVDTAIADAALATSAQVSGIANVGSATNTVIEADNTGGAFTAPNTAYVGGTPTLTFAEIQALDGVYHEIPHSGNVIDIVYRADVTGNGVASSIQWSGYIDGANDSLDVFAWDFTGTPAWVQIGMIDGQSGTVNKVESFDLFTGMTGTVSGTNLGKVYLRIQGTATGPTLHTDQLFVSYSIVSQSVGYAMGHVWLDSNDGVAGTEAFVNGVADNPVATFSDAQTISSSLLLKGFHIAPSSSYTLSASLTDALVYGHGVELALGGQDVDNTHFFDMGVSGTCTAATETEFHHCEVIGTSSFQRVHFYDSTFDEVTTTLSSAGDYRFINCQSGAAGSASPTFALGTGAITCEFRRWSGGIAVTGISTNDTLTIGGELGTVTLGGADGTVEIRGTYKAIVDNRTGSPVLNIDGAIKGVDVATILADTDILQSEWANGGRLDNLLDGASSAGDPWGTTLPAAYGAGTAGEILGDWINGGRLDLILDTAAGGGAGLTSQQVRDSLKLAPTAGAPAAGSIDEHLDNIEADTNELQTDDIPAAIAALDVVVDRVEADTQDIQTQIGTAGAGLSNIGTIATVTTVTNEVTADVTKISGDATAADNLEASLETMVLGTATGGTTSTVTSAITGHGDDTFIGRVMIFRTGVLQYEAGAITDYVSTTGTFTFAAATWTTTPAGTFVIV